MEGLETTEVVETVETVATETEIEDTGGENESNLQTEEPTVEEAKPFNPDEFNFDEEEMINEEDKPVTEYEGYNLDKYKDKIDFSNPDIKAAFTAEAKFYKEHGFNQEQIEALLDKDISKAETDRANLDKRIADDLKNNLTAEEKRNYRQVGDFIKKALGDELGVHYKGFMGNPILVKIANSMYKQSIGGKGNLDIKQKQPLEGMNLSAMKANEEFQNALRTNSYGGNLKQYAQELLGKVAASEKETFKSFLGSILN